MSRANSTIATLIRFSMSEILRAAASISNTSMASPRLFTAATRLNLELTGELEADDQREEGETFDQRRSDDHVRADAAAGFRLTRDAFHRLSSEVADTLGRTDTNETRAETGAQSEQTL